MTPTTKRRAAPRSHLVLLYILAGVLTILLVWLLSFLLHDIGDVSRPDKNVVFRRHVDKGLLDKRDALEKQKTELNGKIEDLKQNQALLSDSTSNARETMNQLLENQKQLASKNIQLSAPEQEAIAASQQLFLDNQKQYQELNTQIVARTNEQRAVKEQADALEETLRPLSEKADREYAMLYERARFKTAVAKLAVLLPLGMLALWLVAKHRKSGYGVMTYPLAIAVLLKTVQVVHEYFPTRYFKYIALLALIMAVVWMISYIVRMIAWPKVDFLLKQYREAYNKQRCPTCAFPMERGALKQLGGTTRARKGMMVVTLPPATREGEAAEKPYSCPSCGERLFEECSQCKAVRHSLLPYCDSCGAVKSELTENTPVKAGAEAAESVS